MPFSISSPRARDEKLRGWSRLIGAAVVLLAAALATAPQLFWGNTCGHDFDIHLVSWFDCLNGWRHGILYPQWTPSANFGAGEPRFVFYPPLTWMLGGALGAVLPWRLVPVALTFLLLAGTGLATRALARYGLAEAPATLAGCTALFSGYALFTAYERSAFGEMAGFWIPLLLLYALRELRPAAQWMQRAFDGSTALLALTIAGAWLCNAPLGVMASYLLAGVAVTVAILRRTWAPILRGAVAAGLGIALTAFYLVPAAWEQRWVDIRQAVDDPGLKIENSFLFAHGTDPDLALHFAELSHVSWIALLMIGVAVAALVVAWRRKTLPSDRIWWISLALIPFVVLVLQLRFSLPVWNLLPKLRFLQFPWRWLVVLEAPVAILVAAAVWPRVGAKRAARIAVSAVCAAAFLGSTAVAARYFFQPCDEEDAVAPMVQQYRSGGGFEGVYEYEPVGADDGIVATGLPDACFVADPNVTLGVFDTVGASPDWWVEQGSCGKTYSATPPAAAGNPEHWRLRALIPHAGYLILRLRTYPAWRVRVNGAVPGTVPAREDGLMVVPVQAGPVEVTADWTVTADVRAGRWLSVLALLLLTGLCLLERRLGLHKAAHLS